MIFSRPVGRTAQAVMVSENGSCAVAARGFVADTVKGGGVGVAVVSHGGTIGHIRAGGKLSVPMPGSSHSLSLAQRQLSAVPSHGAAPGVQRRKRLCRQSRRHIRPQNWHVSSPNWLRRFAGTSARRFEASGEVPNISQSVASDALSFAAHFITGPVIGPCSCRHQPRPRVDGS
jgi:hypothetical protein